MIHRNSFPAFVIDCPYFDHGCLCNKRVATLGSADEHQHGFESLKDLGLEGGEEHVIRQGVELSMRE